MSRILLHYVLPLLLPFIVYGVWLHLERRRARAAGEDGARGWREAPWTWLFVAGAGLVAASIFALALTTAEQPGEVYVAPRVVDGEIVPAEME